MIALIITLAVLLVYWIFMFLFVFGYFANKYYFGLLPILGILFWPIGIPISLVLDKKSKLVSMPDKLPKYKAYRWMRK